MSPWHSQRGISVIDMLVVTVLLAIVAGMTVPSVMNGMDGMRLGQAARAVEREMQIAKSRAVSKGRPMRLRFDCPRPGDYRIVELLGTVTAPTAADASPGRCDTALYPSPATDNNPMTLPNHDGPVRFLDSKVAFDQAQTIEFWPDGTAHYAAAGGTIPWPMIPPQGIEIRLVRDSSVARITVNGLGKIELQTD